MNINTDAHLNRSKWLSLRKLRAVFTASVSAVGQEEEDVMVKMLKLNDSLQKLGGNGIHYCKPKRMGDRKLNLNKITGSTASFSFFFFWLKNWKNVY